MPASCTSPALMEHDKLISTVEIDSDESIEQSTTAAAAAKKQSSNLSKLAASSGSSIEEMIRMRNLKTSQNITESVPVPSSEHVAEIVGRQGCKIKALRAKTNTYIKTPIRGEQPQFVITGRREDVITAKREIQLAADHFSQIRARRGGNTPSSHTPTAQQQQLISSPCNTRHGTPTPPINTPSKIANSVSSSSSSSISLSPPIVHKITSVLDMAGSSSSSSCISPKQLLIDACDLSAESDSTLIRQQQTEQAMQLQPGQIIEKVTVPYQVVGLVVGPRGTTIKRIQQNTNTYIRTPSRDSQPVFDIQGMPGNVAQARIEIENYIQLRTNNNVTPTPPTNGYCSSLSSSSSSSSSSTTEQSQSHGHIYNNNSSSSSCSMMAAYQQNNKNSDYEFFSNAFELMDELKLTKKPDMLHEASIWSSPVNTFTQEDSLVNSIQQNLNPTLNSLNAGIRSSLSSSSSTSSSASSSFSLAKTDAASSSFQFFNSSSNGDQLSGLITGMENMNIMSYGLRSNTDNFLSQLSDNTFSASSSLSSSSSHDSHSLFHHHEHLLTNNSANSDSLSQDFLYPGASTFLTTNFQQQQQPQYF